MSAMSIGEVARRAGVRTSALRFYEEVGILPSVARVNGRRRYDEKTLRMIEILSFARRAGFSLAEIKTLFGAADPGSRLGERWHELAQSKLVELERLVEHAAQMRRAIELGLACGCVQLEDCLIGRKSEKRK